MAFCTAKELVSAGKKNAGTVVVAGGQTLTVDGINETRAQEILKLAFADVLTQNMNAYSKYNRPWKLVNLTEKLDPNQAWFGFEFEMALKSEADFRRLVTYVWHEHNHVAFDREGAGQWSPEISFPPEDSKKFDNGTAGILRLLKWMNDNKIKMDNFDNMRVTSAPTTGAVGQHLNISTPSIRSKKNAVQVATLVAHTMWMMSDAKHKQLFGRVPYGLCRGRDEGAGAYVEFKLFKATDDLTTFKKYVTVSQRMADLLEALSSKIKSTLDSSNVNTPYIENFYDILAGTVRPEDFKISNVPGANAWSILQRNSGDGSGSEWRFHRHGLGPTHIS